MNEKIFTIGAVSAIAIAAVATFGAVSVSAYQGDFSAKGPNYTVEREAAMEAIFAKKDFAGWKTLMTADGRTPGVLRKIDTQDKFNKFADAEILADAGKTTEAAAIRAELGLGNGSGMGMGRGTGTGNGGQRGSNTGGNRVDANGNGVCDMME